MNKKKRKILTEKRLNAIIISSSILFIILVLVLSFFVSLLRSYHATYEAKKFLISDNDVVIEQVDNYYTFKPKKNEIQRGLVFYQGAKVENIAYAPLLYHFAKDTNTFCALLDAPLNIAFFSINEADKLIHKYSEINEWYIAGHSLGGSVASIYASNHLNQVKGLVLLASYSGADLSKSNLKVASIYGDQDLVLNQGAYEKSKKLLPAYSEYIIQGGNHSGFAMYGEQYRDGMASIDKITQIQESVNFCQNTIFTMSE